MQVWLVKNVDVDEVEVFAEDVDILELPEVVEELGYLEGAYDDEREQFIHDIKRAKQRGGGSAEIEERLLVELVDVNIG